MVDPTHDEMLAYLQVAYPEEFREDTEDSPNVLFSAECAIYWFAYGYHGGQWSNLYSALSTSDYHPAAMDCGVEPETLDAIMYADLEAMYA